MRELETHLARKSKAEQSKLSRRQGEEDEEFDELPHFA
jgi:hypothetical protein